MLEAGRILFGMCIRRKSGASAMPASLTMPEHEEAQLSCEKGNARVLPTGRNCLPDQIQFGNRIWKGRLFAF